MVPFAGWEMPVWYTSLIAEHRAVREAAGLFDISHMGRLEIVGLGATAYLDAVTAASADLPAGQGRYTLLCHPEGGIVDDIIFYRRSRRRYFMVVNAGNRQKDWEWLTRWAAGRPVVLRDLSERWAMLALQGPRALALANQVGLLAEPPRRFHLAEVRWGGSRGLMARTGYTGEDGIEVMLPPRGARSLWRRLIESGATPCGLGARDTLRTEAGLSLYGHDIDDSINPIEAGLERFVSPEKPDFIGREALVAAIARPARHMWGLVMEGRDIPRPGCAVWGTGRQIGTVTSGTFGPTVGRGIAMALLDTDFPSAPSAPVEVEIRGHRAPARLATLPFYRRSGGHL